VSLPVSTELRATEERSQRRVPWRAAAAIAAIAVAVVAVVVLVLSDRGGDRPLAVTVPGHPTDLVVTPDAVWVSAATTGSVWALDPASGRRLAKLPLDGTPARLAAGASSLWVVDTAAASLIPVRLSRHPGAIDATPYEPIPTGADATDVAVAGGVLWVLDSAEGIVRAIEPGGGPVRSLRVGSDPVDLAAGGRWVVAAVPGSGTLARIDTQTRRLAGRPIRLGGVPAAVAVTGSTAWVVDTSAGTVVPVNLDSGERGSAIAVGKRPVAVAADGDDVYVLCRADWALVHVDGATGEVLSRRDVGADAVAVALEPRHVWVAGGEDNQVLRFDR
jgi:DNA-binding beta-propeller fold protein YncE